MKSSATARSFVATLVSTAFFWALTLSVSPRLHERIHPDAKQSQHECAVTLVASGNCQHSAAAPLVTAPIPAVQFSKIPMLNPIWVASPFLGASIFEHAPPARG
jgi:hypothetical protein